MRPLISIITPLHNHEQFIGTSIKSVLNQGYTNWEQIIVDDASTDDSLKVATSFAKKDKRIKIIHHKKNWGINKLANNYNHALKYAKGKYVAILESDDYWPKDKLEKQINFMINRKAILSYGNCILVSSGGTPIDLFTYNYKRSQVNNIPDGSILRLFSNLKFSIIPVTVIIRKKELLKVGGFCKDSFYPFTDIPTFLKLALEGKFAYMNEILGFYRKQNISEWYSFASATNAMGREELRNCMDLFLRKHSNHIDKKRRLKRLSIFLNTAAFRYNLNPLFFVFCLKYLYYLFKKFTYENWN